MKYLWILIFSLNQGVLLSQDSTMDSLGNVKTISFEDKLMVRYYFSEKYTNFKIKEAQNKSNLSYKSNTTLNMGLGFTFKSYTLNVAYGFGFLNPNRLQGKTTYLDLQSHSYKSKYSMDLYGEFYKGYFMDNDKFPIFGSQEFYLRPDLSVYSLGFSYARILNSTTFSYNAAYKQNEWQRKSAGSPLIGIDCNFGIVKAEQSLIPYDVNGQMPLQELLQLQYLYIGPSLGYTYTYVLKKHFFMNGSASLGYNLNIHSELNQTYKQVALGGNLSNVYRLATGYNGAKYHASISIVNHNLNFKGSMTNNKYAINTGNVRLTFVKRIKPFKKLVQLNEFIAKKQHP